MPHMHTPGRNLYLKTVPLSRALEVFREQALPRMRCPMEWVPVDACHGRVTAQAVHAVLSNPNYNACAMDGIAVRSAATAGAHERAPVRLRPGTDYMPVDTGDVLQSPYDSVIMVEDVEEGEPPDAAGECGTEDVHGGGGVLIRASAAPWQHVRMMGEDIVAGDMLAPSRHPIRPEDVAAFVAGGLSRIPVLARVRVAILPTGTEIRDVGADMRPGDILDSNSRMIAAMAVEAGAVPCRLPIVPDDREQLKAALLEATACADLVVVLAGSSAGSEDHTAGLLRELGEVWVHGIDIKPGKPAVLGAIGGTPAVGIPGYPVSAYMTFRHVVLPLLREVTGVAGMAGKSASPFMTDEASCSAVLTRRLVSSLKHQEFVRVQVGKVDGRITATPLARGAGAILSLVRANGILVVPRETEGWEAGTEVRVTLTRPEQDLDRTLSVVGSHDLLLDWLADLLAAQGTGMGVLSAHVGSLGGILAMKRGEAHLAPIHLLDPESGTYNLPMVRRHFPNEDMFLLRGIRREQGFYSREPLPEGCGFGDLARRGMRFLNRQKGSGTRLLVDHLLARAGIRQEDIPGYDTEVTTHTGVALSVREGNADIGVGIRSVARQMGLQYAPIGYEEYDFLFRPSLRDHPVFQKCLETLDGKAFRSRLSEAGGYVLDTWTQVLVKGGTA